MFVFPLSTYGFEDCDSELESCIIASVNPLLDLESLNVESFICKIVVIFVDADYQSFREFIGTLGPFIWDIRNP